jgi:biotin operon repressor
MDKERYNAEAKERDLYGYLRDNAKGAGAKVTSGKISADLGIRSGAEIRDIIRGLRRKGFMICSDREGYWFGTELVDYDATIKNLESRFYSLGKTLKVLKNLTALELAGQLKIFLEMEV